MGESNVPETGMSIQDKIPPPEAHKREDESRRYRIGPFSPNWIQPMNNMPCFMIWLLLLNLSCSVANLSAGIPHVEKQFDLSSKMVAFLNSCEDISGLCLMLFVSYIGTKYNMAKGVAAGAFIYGFGSLVMCIPHYTVPATRIEITENKENATDLDICPLTAMSEIIGNISSNSSSIPPSSSTHYTSYITLVFAELLRGLGLTPLFTLGTAYIDTNKEYPASAIYLVLASAATAVGAAGSAIAGGYIVDNVYVDFDKVNAADIPKDSTDPNWIGAWWLTYQISGIVCLFLAFPIFGFPARMPGVQDTKSESDPTKTVEDVSTKSVWEVTKGVVRDFLRAARILLLNAEFVVLALAAAMMTCAAFGMAMFSFKFLTEEYDLSFVIAGYIVAAKAVFSGVAIIFGGWVIRHFKLHALGLERLSFVLSVISAIMGLGLLAGCPNIRLSGIEVPYMGESQTNGLLSECQGLCQCQGRPYNPVCGADDMVYYSPCHAGCTQKIVNGSETIYTNCSCVDTTELFPGSNMGQTARAGRCELGCIGVYISTPLTFLMLFVGVISISNNPIAMLRCVDQDLRPFALGISWIITRLLGYIPSPVFLGAIFDSICLVWSDPVPGEGTRYCQLYDRQKLSLGFCFLWMTGNLLSSLLFLLASVLNVRKAKRKKLTEEKTPETLQNGAET